MPELEGEDLKGLLVNKVKQLRAWVKPDKNDPFLLMIFKMIYKGIAVLILLVFSPIILLILSVIFFATL